MFRSSNKKKQDILEKGQQLFWKHGFKRVTIEEVCAEAKVSKMTFYKFFTNKMDLVRTIMEKVQQYAIIQFEEIMNSDIPFSEKVEKQIQMKMEGTADISKEFMDDLMVHADPEVLQMMQEMSQKTFGLIYESYLKAQKDGHIRQDIKPEFIMYFMNHMFDMISDDQLVKLYDSTSELATELVRFFFYGIMGGKEQKNEKPT
jgi:AcrR family transcriptional regulator